MLWPTEGEALRSAAQTIVDAGIKLVVYDRLIEDFEGLEGQMMGDNFSIGEEMGEKYGVRHLPADFKKREGYKRSIELSKQYELYRQNYCGCEFSKQG